MNIDELKSRFIDICKTHINRDGIDALLEWLEKSDFYKAPASTKHHGAYTGGLLEHSLNVYDVLKNYYELYSDMTEICEQSIAVSALFHDLCKVNFYKEDTRNVKENGVWVAKPCYAINEKFVYGGHGSKSVFLIERFMKLSMDEAVAINCHMGAWDGDKNVGRAYEQLPLAFLLHIADETATFLLEKGGEQ